MSPFSVQLSLVSVLMFEELKILVLVGLIDVPVLTLIVVDVCLLVVFMVQHSCMASKKFKKNTAAIFGAGQRCIYVLITSVSLQFLMYMWQPIDNIIIWNYDTNDSPMMCKHVIYNAVRGYSPPSMNMSKQLQTLLDHLSHPGTASFLIILWLHPFMSLDRWLLATIFTWYLCLQNKLTDKDYQYTEEHLVMKQHVKLTHSTKQYVSNQQSLYLNEIMASFDKASFWFNKSPTLNIPHY
ncbi:hypothetical protein KUTeg_023103, partial [Tegillarca granosa]